VRIGSASISGVSRSAASTLSLHCEIYVNPTKSETLSKVKRYAAVAFDYIFSIPITLPRLILSLSAIWQVFASRKSDDLQKTYSIIIGGPSFVGLVI
jgi:hypothetical protein